MTSVRAGTSTSASRTPQQEKASETVAEALGLRKGARVFHSVIVHLEDRWPIQLEDRYVNPMVASEYLQQDFNESTPNAYLTSMGPVERVEHTIEAVLPDAATAALLRIPATSSCLLLHRRTWIRVRSPRAPG